MKRGLVITFILVASIVVFQQLGSGENNYAKELADHRAEKEDFFKNSAGSPFLKKEVQFKPLNYFPPDKDFKVNARMERLTTREAVSITNSDGSEVKYLKFAYAKFKLQGEECSLLILKELGFGSQYLTAFIDETSGISTYGGGRYLDLIIGKSDRIEIDFNKAYNPYCAYVADYLCPLPPRENFLPLAIEAGEKEYNF